MNYTFIILGIILVIVLWLLYSNLMAKTSVAEVQTYLRSMPASIPITNLTNGNSTSFYYAIWIYVNNLNNGPSTGVTQRMPSSLSDSTKNRDPKTLANNIFYLADSQNQAYLSLDVTSSTLLNTSILLNNTNNSLVQYDITPNFPLQRWEYVIISVNQNFLDLYLDGKLIKSANLGQNPKLPSDNTTSPPAIYFGNGDIYIAGFKRVANAIDPQTAWNQYLNGSGVTKTNFNYGLSMQISKNNTPQSTVKFF
jgi:hypothetical protein